MNKLNLSDGIITSTLFANYSVGMEGSAQALIFKDTSEELPPRIPRYSVLLLIGYIGVISTILIRRRLKS